MKSPAVAIDIRMLRHAGIGTYIRNVVPRVIAARPDWRFTLLTRRGAPPAWPLGANTTTVPCASDIYTLGEQVELPLKTPKGVDLFWSPHYNIPVLSRTPLVVTVHDVGHLAMAAMYSGAARQMYARQMLGAVRRRAREIMFVSEFSRAEYKRFVGEPRRSVVIHNGVDASWHVPASGPAPHPRPYVLFVGSAKPHKNLDALLRAFERLLGTVAHDLVIVGGQTKQRTVDTVAMDLAVRLASRVRVVDDADDEAVKRFVANAAALVLPSLYEGFGLPAIEAMAAGCPCIVSAAASLPEVCGDAAVYCDPRDPADIARQIARLLADEPLRTRLVDAGRARAAQFDWNVSAAQTATVLERALDVA